MSNLDADRTAEDDRIQKRDDAYALAERELQQRQQQQAQAEQQQCEQDQSSSTKKS
jgi:hypothetical protein